MYSKTWSPLPFIMVQGWGPRNIMSGLKVANHKLPGTLHLSLHEKSKFY